MNMIVRVTGDTNDADYVSIEIKQATLDKVVFEDSEHLKETKISEIINSLVNVLEKYKSDNIKRYKTWTRPEFDSLDIQIQTATDILIDLGYTINEDDDSDENIDKINDMVMEMIEQMEVYIVPYCEFGIHSFVEIETYPEPEVKKLFSKK